MRFKEFDYKKIKKRNNLHQMITDFRNSGIKCAILVDWEYVSAAVGARSINSACVRYKTPYIKAVINGEEIYLINELIK